MSADRWTVKKTRRVCNGVSASLKGRASATFNHMEGLEDTVPVTLDRERQALCDLTNGGIRGRQLLEREWTSACRAGACGEDAGEGHRLQHRVSPGHLVQSLTVL